MKVKLPERRAVSAPGRQDGGAPAAAPLKTRGGKTARRVLRRIGYIAACCCCVGVMLASVAAVVFASYLARLSGTDADMPDLYVLKMAENSIVYAADPAGGDWTEYAVFTGENDRVWTPLEQFPQTLRDAVVSVEDRNFWNQRFGINPGRILGAAVNELTGHRLYGSRQGASTLEQQLIENLTGDSAQSISGKFKEISRAIVMAGRYSKDMILEAYLNIAPLTGTLSGMQAGAQQYFGKDASQLTLAESATLASIPRSPVAYSPYSNPEKLLERRNWVLKLMLDQKRISQADYDAAAAAPLGVRSREEAAAASPRGKVNSYFTDAVFEQLADDIMEKENCGRAAAVTRIRTGGLRIFSTVDLRLQRMLEAFMENDGEDGYFPALWRQEEADTGIPFDSADAVSYGDDGLPLNAQGEPVFRPDDTPVYEQDGTTLLRGSSAQPNADGVHTLVFYRNIRTQAAVATMDYEGHVLALVGGVGEKRYDLSLNRAADVPRQIGSTMKPLAAYALGIENGVINYSSLIADAPLYTQQDHRMLNTEYCRKLGLSLDPGDPANQARDDVWRDWPTNYNGPGTGRPVVVADALAQSLNTVPVQIGDMLGKRRLFDFAYGSLGLTHLDPERDNDLGPLVLGSQTHGVTPVQLANAYSVFRDGVYRPALYYTKVTLADGSTYLDPAQDSYAVQAVSPQTAYIMNRLLRGVLTAPGGTARGMAPAGEMEAAAKTGTTTDYRDFTFVGLTPYYVTAGWWGYDVPADLSQQGVRTGKPLQTLWRDYMQQAQEGLPYLEFPVPEGVVARRYDPATGCLVPSGGAVGYYTEDNLPPEQPALP